MEKEIFGQFNIEHLKNAAQGVVLFNEQKYWECHEDLEDHWLEARGDNAKYVYWAIIQVAASMIHYRDEKITGARGLIVKAKEKFRKIDELNVQTKLMETYLSWSKLKKLVNEVPDDPELEDFKELFEFRFKNPSEWDIK